MIVGVPRETKTNERRVALTPPGTRELVELGHTVIVERDAGRLSSISDDEYAAAGADTGLTTDTVFADADLLLKVKEPQLEEVALMHEEQLLFTYLHLAAYPRLAKALLDSGATCIGYETVEIADGTLPLLAPMSEIAGRMAPQVGARFLESSEGGKGTLLGGASGVRPADVLILGAGIAGVSAAYVAAGMGANVTVLDIDVVKLRMLNEAHIPRVTEEFSSSQSIETRARASDLIIGAVLIAGARAPVVMGEGLISSIGEGTVLVDISIDQGGCFATSRETTHDAPVFVEHGVVHYAVGNIPAVVPHTSTYALTNSTLRYVLAITGGVEQALTLYPELEPGVNIAGGAVTNPVVAEALGESSESVREILVT